MSAFFTAFSLSLLATGAMVWFARRIGFVHKPKGERWSSRPVAMGGGIAIVAAWIAGVVLWMEGGDYGAVAAVLVMFGLGFVDDVFTVSPKGKLAVEFLVAGGLIALGYRFPFDSDLVSFAVTFFW
ncbi:MAG: hypothetical protein HUU37_09575, partial [Bdellovibrionales bacterium]|nr:hypothetical protein [Bdellovibrionales bacterium]